MLQFTERSASILASNAFPVRRGVRARDLELLLFSVDPAVVREASDAGMDGFIVDWERRGKARRQAGEGTQINHHTLGDLRRVRRATDRRVICRLNALGPWTGAEMAKAIDAGADELLLPMVRRPEEVDTALELLADRRELGILVETQAAVDDVVQLAQRPLARIYLGLNDLRIDRSSTSLFTPLVDGTAEDVAAACAESASGVRFGAAGLTLPERGAPIPSSLIAAELARLGAGFTFLRRSFTADTAGRPLEPAVAAIRAHLASLDAREVSLREADHGLLADVVLPGRRRWTA